MAVVLPTEPILDTDSNDFITTIQEGDHSTLQFSDTLGHLFTVYQYVTWVPESTGKCPGAPHPPDLSGFLDSDLQMTVSPIVGRYVLCIGGGDTSVAQPSHRPHRARRAADESASSVISPASIFTPSTASARA